jgi:4-hydroxy-2-oxoglutarate aldolase
MTTRLQGVFAPVITTFYPQGGELDVASFAANIRSHVAAGLHGIVVAGSTGEAALLDANERAAMVDVAREMVPRDRTLIVGTGAESTRTCLQLTRDAAARGADAVLVVAPHYYGTAMTGTALSLHYRRIADSSPVPVVLYNIPKYMHFALAPGLVSELSLHQNVIGIKDSSGDRGLLSSYLNAESDDFTVLTGNAGIFRHALKAGARGGILAVALFAAALSLEVYDATQRGDDETADAAQARLSPLGASIVAELGVAGVKAAMDHVGLIGGPVRPPLVPLDGQGTAQVAEVLRSAELATVA